MNRKMRRASIAEGRRLQKLDWDPFQDVTQQAIHRSRLLGGSAGYQPDAVYQNHKYIVQVFKNQLRKGRTYTKAMVRRCDSEPIYSWKDLYRIKNEIFGDEVEAVQFMPPVSELTDVANLYWFWIEETEVNERRYS